MFLINRQHAVSEYFVPEALRKVEATGMSQSMRDDAATALEEMFAAAKEEGVTLSTVSGYRSYSKQSTIYARKKASQGEEEADRVSARPGTSEHQLGLAMDISKYPAMIKAKVGWSYIQWSVDTYDWRGRSTSLIMSKTKKQFTDGDIVLMHDIKDNTPNTAKVMAEWLYEQGYMLLTVDELFAKDGVTLEPDTVYFRCDDGVTTIKK